MNISHCFDEDYISCVASLPSGTYFVDYTDNTHLKDNTWVQLLQIDIEPNQPDASLGEEAVTSRGFDILVKIVLPAELSAEDKNDTTGAKNFARIKVILDQLALCFVRSGCMAPLLSSSGAADLIALQNKESLVLIPDTNALANGSLHWLLRVFSRTNVSLLPVSISLVQVQEHDRDLKSMVNEKRSSNLKSALRSRTLVNSSLSLLEKCGERYQVIAVEPELLRYVRPSSNKKGEQDQSDVLEDRLFVEAIHNVLRAARSRTVKRVVTSDVTFARILHAEAIPSLFFEVPRISLDEKIECIRFDAVAKRFMGCTLPNLLWNLADTFSTVRIRQDTDELVKLETYWMGKTAEQWISDHRCITVTHADKDTKSEAAEIPHAVSPENDDIVDLDETFHFSKLATPNISLVPVLALLGAVQTTSGTLDIITNKIPKQFRPSSVAATYAAEVLLQAGLIKFEDNKITDSSRATELSDAIRSDDLDQASSIFCDFKPYAILLNFLKERGFVPDEMNEELRDRLGRKSSLFAYRNLRPYLVYFGQAWTNENSTLNGSARPSNEDFIRAFTTSFEQCEKANFASIEDLILAIAKERDMSPWSVKRQLEKLISADMLRGFRFEPASGGKGRTRDRTVAGTLTTPRLEPVLIDRIVLSGRPVFTATRR